MLRIHRLWPLRRFAALLTMSGVLLLPLRPLLACSMPDAERAEQAAVGQGEHAEHSADAEHSAHTEHAEHDEHHAPADAGSSGNAHDICPDLAHCVAAALRHPSSTLPTQLGIVTAALPDATSRPVSAGRSLDTPPPKQA